jgi:hypothetical protein
MLVPAAAATSTAQTPVLPPPDITSATAPDGLRTSSRDVARRQKADYEGLESRHDPSQSIVLAPGDTVLVP